MTVPSETKRKEYSGSGSAGPFTIDFPILSKTHLKVSKVVVATGVTTELTLDAGSNGYTVNAGLTTITLTEVLASGEKLVILRDLPLKQETDYIANNAFPAETNEQALDYLTMVAQQLDEKIDRAILLPETSSTTGVTIDDLVDDEVLTYDTATKQIKSSGYSVTDFATDISAASTSAATATTQAGIATTQANNAASSASSALTSANTATTQASNASSSASSSSTSASTATTQAGIATTQASNAAASAVLAGSTFIATSTTSNTIGTGSKSFTTQTNKNFQVNQYMLISDSAASTTWMFGQVTSYNNGTGALVFDSQVTSGSGTIASWNITISGIRGAAGAGSGDFSSNTATSVDGEAVVFSGTGGKTGKRFTGTGLVRATSGVLAGSATVALTELATQAANTFVANATASTAAPTAAVSLGASQLAGRGSTGNLAAITLGANLSMSGTTLNASSSSVISSSYVSSGQTISNGGTLTLAHGLGVEPKLLKFVLQCTTANLNYSVGDRVLVSSSSQSNSGTDAGFNVLVNSTNIIVNFWSNAAMTISDKSSRGQAVITVGSWQLYVEAYA